MTDVAAGQPVNPTCPRCGYDQRGVVALWTDACPLRGTCSECGLEFSWSDLLVSWKFEPQWCVEFVASWMQTPFAAAKTLCRSFWPRSFWSSLNMSLRIRARRLVAYVAMLLVPFVLMYIAGQTVLAVLMGNQVRQSVLWSQRVAPQQIARMSEQLSFMQLAQQMQQKPLEAQQLLDDFLATQADAVTVQANITMYQGMDSQHLSDWMKFHQQHLAAMQSMATAPPTIRQSYIMAAVEAIFFPFSYDSWGTIQYSNGSTTPYPGPRQNLQLIQNSPIFSPGGPYTSLLDRSLLAVISAIFLTALLPACFVLLPVSRRLAKVRWAHVWRILVYSLFGIFTLLFIMSASVAVLLYDSSLWIAEAGLRFSPLILWIALPWWWAVAIKRYLRMPHAGAIALLMTVMLALMMSPCLFMVLPEWFVRMILG